MSQRLFKVQEGHLVAKDLLAVVEYLAKGSRRPPYPGGLYGQTGLHIVDLGEVKVIATEGEDR